ncbi:Uncharacterised protein [Mycobacterium tuberculosis]|nr:Uncharacterised protein [Mycobacterium tuberculosis]CPA66240.1 Uncharacterised protein [Mycobacterium tuberculosis]
MLLIRALPLKFCSRSVRVICWGVVLTTLRAQLNAQTMGSE